MSRPRRWLAQGLRGFVGTPALALVCAGTAGVTAVNDLADWIEGRATPAARCPVRPPASREDRTVRASLALWSADFDTWEIARMLGEPEACVANILAAHRPATVPALPLATETLADA